MIEFCYTLNQSVLLLNNANSFTFFIYIALKSSINFESKVRMLWFSLLEDTEFYFGLKHVNVMEITFIESYEGRPLCVLQHEY